MTKLELLEQFRNACALEIRLVEKQKLLAGDIDALRAKINELSDLIINGKQLPCATRNGHKRGSKYDALILKALADAGPLSMIGVSKTLGLKYSANIQWPLAGLLGRGLIRKRGDKRYELCNGSVG